jgi:tetratricopeptide (TPR) repeat protein
MRVAAAIAGARSFVVLALQWVWLVACDGRAPQSMAEKVWERSAEQVILARRMRWRRCQASIGCWFALAWSSQLAAQAPDPQRPSSAPGGDAMGMRKAGEGAYARGDFVAALQAFERAYDQEKEPRGLFRIGDAADKLGLHARAASAFQQYLSVVPHAKDRAFIESRFRANQAALGAAADHGATLPPPVRSPVAPLRAAPTQPERAASFAVLGSSARARVRVHAETDESPPARGTRDRAAPGAALRATQASSESTRVGPWWLWAGAGGVVVVGIVIAALSLGSSATSPEPVRGNLGSAVQTLMRP